MKLQHATKLYYNKKERGVGFEVFLWRVSFVCVLEQPTAQQCVKQARG